MTDIAACIHQQSILQQQTLKATSNTWQRYMCSNQKAPLLGFKGWLDGAEGKPTQHRDISLHDIVSLGQRH